MRVVDFFCGAGGFSEGFRQAGYDVIFAVDKWEPAVRTYKANKPNTIAVLDDVIRISNLPDNEFHRLVPNSEIIIGSPPCQAFSNSNKSGKGDKNLGIMLLKAYLRIVARKMFMNDSILRYWVLENVPNIKEYIEKEYSASDLGLEGDFVLKPLSETSGIYNSKNFGAPTSRKRFLCGNFPPLIETHDDSSAICLQKVLDSLGEPKNIDREYIEDINYPGLILPINQVSDQQYIYEVQPFEWKTAKRLKLDRGYMGKMSFPENTLKPARTVMATISASSRESMILPYGDFRFRLPTVREIATMMSFPIEYRFFGKSIGTKYRLVGNAVPPKLSYAIAVSILRAMNHPVPKDYPKITSKLDSDFVDLNFTSIAKKVERRKNANARFKYHIPYLIIKSFRVELTNFDPNNKQNGLIWRTEIRYGQGKKNSRIYTPSIDSLVFPEDYQKEMTCFIESLKRRISSSSEFQLIYCSTTNERIGLLGPFELLDEVKCFLDENIKVCNKAIGVMISGEIIEIPEKILVGYYLLDAITNKLGEKMYGSC